MAKLTTRKALQQLLIDEDYVPKFLQAGYSKEDRRRFKNRFRQGKMSLKMQHEILQQCGYTVAVEKQWLRP